MKHYPCLPTTFLHTGITITQLLVRSGHGAEGIQNLAITYASPFLIHSTPFNPISDFRMFSEKT